MKVVRIDLFDFNIAISEEEFNELKVVMDKKNMSIEDVIGWFIDYGITFLVDDYR